jgi:hypothetical protein
MFKFVFGLWTLSLIAALIEREFGKKLSLASVSRIMKLLGFSAQKPLYQAWQQDATLVRTWETELYPPFVPKPKLAGRRSTLQMSRAFVPTTIRARLGRRWAKRQWWK